jgi:hypothetical protein
MVKGFIIKSTDLATMRQITIGLAKLPMAMSYFISSKNPLEVNITPATDKVKLAMYKDKLTGIKGKTTKEHYLNIMIPFFRQYVRDIRKMEVIVYD